MDVLLLRHTDAFLRYQDLPGSKPPHVFLAGLGGAATAVFPRVVRAAPLSAYRAIIPDWLGCGFSDRPEMFGYTISDHADTILQLLDDLQVTACTVIGHSMGGAVAITLAAQRPDLVGRLILAEANLDAGGGVFSQSVAEVSEDEFVRRGYNGLMQTLQSDSRTGNRMAPILAGLLQATAPYALHRGAVSLVQGTQPSWRDMLYQLTMSRAYVFGADSLPDPDSEILPAHGIKIAIVPQAGHGMVWENPDAFAEVIGALSTE
jgi:pimeloyl-ACP methyl ester carboxylesterase